MRAITLLLFFAVLFSSCEKQSKKDRDLILKYISDNNLNAVEGPEGLFYVIDQAGAGGNPSTSSTVTVHYEGFLLDGSKFDSSIDRGTPSTFGLSQVIRGWQLGIPFFKSGGKGKLIIPSSLGYGSQSVGNGDIPANSVLIFNIELISFQ